MKPREESADQAWDQDAVWKLLDQAPPRTAGPRFVDDTMRAAKLLSAKPTWWDRLVSPVWLGGAAAAAAGVALAVFLVPQPHPAAGPRVSLDFTQASDLQEIAETETLIAAADQLENFSDTELVSLIGF